MNEQGLAFLVCSNLNRNQCCDANMAVQDGHVLRRQFLTALFCPYICSQHNSLRKPTVAQFETGTSGVLELWESTAVICGEELLIVIASYQSHSGTMTHGTCSIATT